MSEKHTPGRLVVRPHGGNWSASYEGYGATAYMGIVSDTGEVVALATAYSPNPFNEPEGPGENARRLAAAWNACEGVPTEMLEKAPLDTVLKETVAQRDELLAMLNRAVRRLESAHARGETIMRHWIVDARALIAKVKGENT